MAIFPERINTHMRKAYVLLIEGCPFAFTDEYELADGHGPFGSSWWADDADAVDQRAIKLGLSVPKSLKISLDLETGIIEEDQAVFNILDIDGTVPYFFGGETKEFTLLGQRLTPVEDPAPATIDAYGNALVLDGKYVGTEAIGPGGQRNWYSACPYWENDTLSLPGQDHPSKDEPLPVVTTSSVGPYLIEGRRVALYRIIYGETLSPPRWYSYTECVSNAIDNNYSPMIWWGTLRQAGKVDGRSWSINCVGPGSWLRKSLNSRTTTKWYGVTSDFQIPANEKHIGVLTYKRYYNDGSYVNCGFTYSTYTVDDTNITTVVSSINTAIQAAASAAGTDGTFSNIVPGYPGTEGYIEFVQDHIKISSGGADGYQIDMKLILARSVWKMLGYDPDVNVQNDDGPGPHFSPGVTFDFLGANPDIAVDPPPVYYTALCTTCPFGMSPLGFTGDIEWASGSKPKYYEPNYPQGVSILKGLGDQIIHVTPEDNEEIYVESQIIRPHYNAGEINGIPVNCERLWLFRGKIQYPKQPNESEQAAPVDTIQVARCLWVEVDPGIMAPDETALARGMYIAEWLDPRLFGLNYKPIDPSIGWASNNGGQQIECSPLAHFGAYYQKLDPVYQNLLRILTSTGTSVWDVGTEEPTIGDSTKADDNAIIDVVISSLTDGQNNKNTSQYNWPGGDYEIYDLGLHISRYMVDEINMVKAYNDLDLGLKGSKICIQGGPIQSEDLLQAILAPRYWVMSLKRGKYGVFAPNENPEAKFEDGLDFIITESDLHGIAGEPSSVIPSVELRPVYPFDRINWSSTGNPTEDWLSGQYELKYKARDIGARARSGTRVKDISAPDLFNPQWFADGNPDNNPNFVDWQQIPSPFSSTAVPELWEIKIPTFLAKAHRKIEGLRISRIKGQDIYPGAIIRLTNPWPANSTGDYGYESAFARVISAEHETDSCACIIDVLVYAETGTQRWAPILRVEDYDITAPSDRYDSTTKTFTLSLNWSIIDIEEQLNWFIKPDYVNELDQPACVWILQYDGVTWYKNGYGFVSSVNPGARTLTLDGTGLNGGTFYERMYTIIVMAPADDPNQVQWVKTFYAQHTLEANAEGNGIKPLIP